MKRKTLNSYDEKKQDPNELSCQAWQYRSYSSILQDDFNLNTCYMHGNTPLFTALACKRERIASFLVYNRVILNYDQLKHVSNENMITLRTSLIYF